MLFILVGIIGLGVLIFVHELGHFLLAKFHGVGVVEFSIGFGKKIWSRQVGDTVYSLGVVPLGGYVRMVGDDPRLLELHNGSDAPAAEKVEKIKDEPALGSDILEGRKPEEMTDAEKKLLTDPSKWFLKKAFLPKFNIVIAGPLFNVLFALLLAFLSISWFGIAYDIVDKPIIGSTYPKFPAERAGILPGDYVRSINGKVVTTWVELASTIEQLGESEMILQVERKSADQAVPHSLEIRVKATYETGEITALDDEPQKKPRGMIGIQPQSERREVSISEAVVAAPRQVWRITVLSIRGIVAMLRGSISPKHLAGPIFIFGEAARQAERGAVEYLNFLILLSVSLAIFNLLPIPVLDGGHLLFFLVELVRGRPVSLRVQQYATQAGMVLLLGLMLFAVSNDLMRYFDK